MDTTTNTNKSRRGGARPGAGRKPAAVKREPLTLRVTGETVAYVHVLRRDYGKKVNECVERYIKALAVQYGIAQSE